MDFLASGTTDIVRVTKSEQMDETQDRELQSCSVCTTGLPVLATRVTLSVVLQFVRVEKRRTEFSYVMHVTISPIWNARRVH